MYLKEEQKAHIKSCLLRTRLMLKILVKDFDDDVRIRTTIEDEIVALNTSIMILEQRSK